MATICFSMSGEGRGHATRVAALVEALRPEGHRMVLFAPGDAHELLAPVYRGTNVEVIEIPCPRFAYTRDKRLDVLATARGAFKYLMGLPKLVRRLEKDLRERAPDLLIVDFEPAAPRAAERAGIPYIAVNHQHTFVVNRHEVLPARLRFKAWWMGIIVKLYHRKERGVVVSQFYFPPVKERFRDRVVHAGVLLRPEILAARATDEGFLLVYLKKFGSANIMAALRACGRPVRVYGLGEKPAEGNISYHKVDNHAFVRDLAACSALLSSSGNQLVGEAFYLGKPVFALPEPDNDEQIMNCHYLAASGGGRWAEMDRVRPEEVQEFLGSLDTFRSRIDRERMNGTPAALEAIRKHLPH